MFEPLWTLEDYDDGIDTHCANCGKPFEGSGELCPACILAAQEVNAMFGVNFDEDDDNGME